MIHLKLILLITSFVLPFVLSITMLFRVQNISVRIMTFTLVNSSLVFLFNYLYFQQAFHVYSYLHSLHIGTVLCLYPSIYLYVSSLIRSRIELKEYIAHLIPAFVFTIVALVLFNGLLSLDERVYYLSTYRSQHVALIDWRLKAVSVFRLIDVLVIFGQIVFYTYRIIKDVNRFQEKILNEFSYADRYSLMWLKRFVSMFIVLGVMFISFYVFNPYSESNSILLMTVLFVTSMFIWIMGLLSLRQRSIGDECTQQFENNTMVQVTDTDDQLLEKLLSYMEMEKPYLQPDMSLTTLSRELGTNRTYLSSLINQQLGMNFNAFINDYRAKYVVNYQLQYPAISKDDLSTVAGFGSVSTMKRSLAVYLKKNK